MSIYGNSVMLGSGGESASIVCTGDILSTDTVYATKDGKTKYGVYSSYSNPEYVLPDGYTQLEKISATTTQWINANFSSDNPTIEIKYGNVTTTSSNAYIFGKYGTDPYFSAGARGSTLVYRVGSGSATTTTTTLGSTFVCKMDFTSLRIDGATVATYIQSGTISYFGIFAGMSSAAGAYSRTRLTSADCYYCKLWDGSTLVRNLIPCKRDSDSAIGMYDLVSNSFFGNSGSGSFTAGDTVPKTITVIKIGNINEFGTYHVVAQRTGETDFEKDVVVDTAIAYEVEVGYAVGTINIKATPNCTEVKIVSGSTTVMAEWDDNVWKATPTKLGTWTASATKDGTTKTSSVSVTTRGGTYTAIITFTQTLTNLFTTTSPYVLGDYTIKSGSVTYSSSKVWMECGTEIIWHDVNLDAYIGYYWAINSSTTGCYNTSYPVTLTTEIYSLGGTYLLQNDTKTISSTSTSGGIWTQPATPTAGQVYEIRLYVKNSSGTASSNHKLWVTNFKISAYQP